jgi:hypothetical protein
MAHISLESSSNLNTNILAQNTCHICFLYHFDLGSKKYLIEGIHKEDFKDIKNKIEEVIGNELVKITYNEKIIMKTPMYLKNINPKDYPISKGYLHIDINLSNQGRSIISKEYEMSLFVAHIDLFDTGVTTVNLQFKLDFTSKLDPIEIFHAYEKIYSKIREPLRQEQIKSIKTDSNLESDELSILKQIYEVIKSIRKKFEKGELYTEGAEWSLAPYPLFCIPKIQKERLDEFFSLLYLKPQVNLDNILGKNQEICDTKEQYSVESEDNHFITMVNAALLIDNDERDIESLCYTFGIMLIYLFISSTFSIFIRKGIG